jgi:hypothetical protein
MEEDVENTNNNKTLCVRKCGLARLGCEPIVRDCFDNVAFIMQRYAVYGSLFANYYGLYILENNFEIENITNQKLWYQIINMFSIKKDNKKENLLPHISDAFTIFKEQGPIEFLDSKYLGDFMSDLARQMLTNIIW